MTLAEQMENMMAEIRAIKLLSQSIQNDLNHDISINGVKKIANLMALIDGVVIPDLVSTFEDVNELDHVTDSNAGLA